MARNLQAMGAEVKEFEDGLDVPGGQQLHGAVVDSDVPVTPGQTLYVYVGGNGAGGASTAGGFNGGGNASGYDGGASGGAVCSMKATCRQVVAPSAIVLS